MRQDVGDDGAQQIANALQTNGTLTELNLACCKIGHTGIAALAKA